MATHPTRRQIRHRHLGLDAHPRAPRPSRLLDMVPGCSNKVFKTWLASAPTRGASASRSSQWMDSPVPSAPPPKNSPTQGRSWIPSTSYTWPVMLSMSVAGAFSKNFTIGAGGPRIPSTRPAGCYTPDPACSPHANNTASSTCSPVRSTSHSKSPGAPTRTSSTPTAHPTRVRVRP